MELSNEIQASCEADLYRPLFTYVRMRNMGRNHPPYIPKTDLFPLYKQCELALLWHSVGFVDQAKHLAAWLLKLEPFPSLWCSEKEFDEKKLAHVFSKLKEIEPIEGYSPDFDLTLIETPRLKAALTLDGKSSSLGFIRAGVEIRAFGPQGDYLNFGIDGKGMNGWTRTAGYPEVWLEMKHEIRGDKLGLDFRFVGVKPENPLFLAFYVKADSCQIGQEQFLPKSLQRFYGEAQKVQFQNKCTIECSFPQKVEVIPLAGEGCFWDSEFLVSFLVSSINPQISLNIS